MAIEMKIKERGIEKKYVYLLLAFWKGILLTLFISKSFSPLFLPLLCLLHENELERRVARKRETKIRIGESELNYMTYVNTPYI